MKAPDDDNGQTDPEGPAGFAAVAGQNVPKDKGGQVGGLPPLFQGFPAISLNVDLIGPVTVAAAFIVILQLIVTAGIKAAVIQPGQELTPGFGPLAGADTLIGQPFDPEGVLRFRPGNPDKFEGRKTAVPEVRPAGDLQVFKDGGTIYLKTGGLERLEAEISQYQGEIYLGAVQIDLAAGGWRLGAAMKHEML